MDDYTQNPVEQEATPTQEHSGLGKAMWALIILIVIGGVFTYVGTKMIGDYTTRDDETSIDVMETDFAALEDVGINTDLSNVPGIPDNNANRMSETWDFRKTADFSFYEDRVAQALEDGNIGNWADAQIELASAYIDQGGGAYAEQASDALKEVIAHKELNARIRAKALRNLAGLFCRAGLDMTVPDKIYTGIYASFFTEGDPMLAARRMMTASYDMYPRARTAVSIAYMYTNPIVNNDLTAAEKADSRDQGLTFLRNAEVLARDTYNPNEIDGEYSSYLFWRAVAYGQLAMEYDEYVDDAQEAYDDLFGYIGPYTGTYTTSVTNIIPLSHYRYVHFLTEVYGDDASEDIASHLGMVVTLVEDDPMPDVNVFLKFLANARKQYETTGEYSHWLNDARVYSSEYDAFLDSHGLPELTT